MYANAHFRGPDTVAVIPEDFLGLANREERQREEALSQQIVMQANMALQKIRRGQPPTDDVPAWAIGPYLGKGIESNA